MSERAKNLYHKSLLLFSLALLGGLGFYIHKFGGDFIKLQSIRPEYIALLLALHALDYWLLGTSYKLPLKKHQITLKFNEWYGLCMVSELFNMILPAKGGTGIRMLYIKDKKGLAMREFLSMSFAVLVIGFTFLGFIGLFYCHFFLKKNHTIFLLLESVFVALTVSGIALIFATEAISKFFKFKRRYSPKIYLQDVKLTTLTTLCWLGMFLLYPLKIYLSFLAIGIHLNLASSFEISLILLVASLFQILPGNMGVKEIVTAYLAKQYGIQFETALLASLLERTILLLFLFPVGFYFYWQLFLEATLPKFLMPSRWEQTSP